jgi:hypothetical protein
MSFFLPSLLQKKKKKKKKYEMRIEGIRNWVS